MQLARERRGRHRLAGTRRPHQQHVGGRHLAVAAQHRALLLLPHDAGQPPAHIVRQDHAGERDLGVGALDQAPELAAWTGERDRRLATRRPTGPLLVAGFLDEALQLVRVLRPPLTGFLRRDLERDRQKLFLVALDVRIEESDQMLRRQSRLLYFAPPRFDQRPPNA